MEPDQPEHPDEGAEERAWRAIVENYGERPEIDEPPTATAATPASEPPASDPPVSDAPFGGRFGDPRTFLVPPEGQPAAQPADEDEEGFVPPPPPPLPRLEPDRMLAWAGVLGSPVVLLLALIFSISMPAWLGYLLVLGFVGGFIYLVVTMPREPREPWDDGAQV